MSNDRITTTGYRLADGRYFTIKTTGKKVVVIRQILFGCGIYPAPAKDVPEKEWPEVLASIFTDIENPHGGASMGPA